MVTAFAILAMFFFTDWFELFTFFLFYLFYFTQIGLNCFLFFLFFFFTSHRLVELFYFLLFTDWFSFSTFFLFYITQIHLPFSLLFTFLFHSVLNSIFSPQIRYSVLNKSKKMLLNRYSVMGTGLCKRSLSRSLHKVDMMMI